MTLNDLKKPIRNTKYYKSRFGDRRDIMRTIAGMWNTYFLHTRGGQPWPDLAIWEISDEITLRPASTQLDESHLDFQRPHGIVYIVTGFQAQLSRIERRKEAAPQVVRTEREALRQCLRNQINEAIVKTFLFKSTQKKFNAWNPEQHPFSILGTDADQGLHQSDFRLLWKNERGPSVRQVKNRAKRVSGKPLVKETEEKTRREIDREKWKAKQQRERKQIEKYRKQAKAAVAQRKPAIRRKLKRMKLDSAVPTKQATDYQATKHFLVSLEDGNQQYRILSTKVDAETLVDIHAKYLWSEFDDADNRMWEYRYAFLDPVLKKYRRLSFPLLWSRLNRPQKTFYALLEFDGETNNGGVWQFLFNSPELSLAALEAMREVGADQLGRDYRATLCEMGGKASTLGKLRRIFEDQRLTSRGRWSAFVRGYDTLTSTQTIEKYYYTAKFKRLLYRKMANYVESHFTSFAQFTGSLLD